MICRSTENQLSKALLLITLLRYFKKYYSLWTHFFLKSHFHPFPFNHKGQGKTPHQPRFSLQPWALRKMSNSMRYYLLDKCQPKLLLARSSSRGRPWISFLPCKIKHLLQWEAGAFGWL